MGDSHYQDSISSSPSARPGSPGPRMADSESPELPRWDLLCQTRVCLVGPSCHPSTYSFSWCLLFILTVCVTVFIVQEYTLQKIYHLKHCMYAVPWYQVQSPPPSPPPPTECFHLPKLCPYQTSTPQSPFPGTHHSTFYPYERAHPGYLIEVQSQCLSLWLWLIYFTQHNVLQVYPCCSVFRAE